MKLTRKTIEEGLQSIPIETLLLGASKEKNRLTPKQRKFAEGLAKGKSKAQAYREAYDSRMKPVHESLEGQRLAANPIVARQVDALIVAEEARKHATPQALRALVIERLTRHALDDDIPPAQRLRALELLGKVTEVAAFTERREVVTHTNPGEARARLLSALRLALQAGATDAESLMREIRPDMRPDTVDTPQASSPGDAAEPTPPPPARALAGPPDAAMHSIPHTQSDAFDVPQTEDTPPPLQKAEPPAGEDEYRNDPPLESRTSSSD